MKEQSWNNLLERIARESHYVIYAGCDDSNLKGFLKLHNAGREADIWHCDSHGIWEKDSQWFAFDDDHFDYRLKPKKVLVDLDTIPLAGAALFENDIYKGYIGSCNKTKGLVHYNAFGIKIKITETMTYQLIGSTERKPFFVEAE